EPNDLVRDTHGRFFQIEGSAAPVEVTCLAGPTAPRRPTLRGGTQWRPVFPLALNSLSIVREPGGGDALKDFLRCSPKFRPSQQRTSTERLAAGRHGAVSAGDGPEYSPTSRDVIDNRSLIERLLSVSTSRVTRYVPSAMPGTWCRGLRISLVMDHADDDD